MSNAEIIPFPADGQELQDLVTNAGLPQPRLTAMEEGTWRYLPDGTVENDYRRLEFDR